MLFNSLTFTIFLALSLTFFYLSKFFVPVFFMKWVLILSSLFIYGWREPWMVLVLFSSTYATFYAVRWMKGSVRGSIRFRLSFYFGLVSSLGNLIFWKYTDKAFSQLNTLSFSEIGFFDLVIPLGISFYTFQQFTYVMDGRSQKLPKINLTDYLLYVTFFPQLIIGPIVRHDEFLPQIMHKRFGRFRLQNLIVGSSIFAIGLGKKIIIADNLALIVDPVFLNASLGRDILVIDCWFASIAYTLQIYFDFSGYSDMAVGTARMFGIRLPENFHSPLKATSILDFWRRWHITLTRLTTRYVFNPTSLFFTRLTTDLKLPKYLIIVVSAGPASFLTFVLIGLWHGLSWPFLLFGVIHSVMSLVEYLYFPKMEYLKKSDRYSLLKTSISRVVTLLLVMFSLILFRSYDISSFFNLIEAMFNYKSSMKSSFLSNNLMNSVILLIAFIISQSQPNTTEIFKRYRSVISTYHGYRKQTSSFSWRINWLLIFCIATVLGLSVMYRLRGSAAFIYANF